MSLRDPDWLRRILDAEDLTPAESGELEVLLVAHPEARRVLARLRALENTPAPRGEIQMTSSDAVPFASPSERTEAEESLRLLLARVVGTARIEERRDRPALAARKSWGQRLAALFPPPILVPAAVGVLALFFFRFGPSGETHRPPSLPSGGAPGNPPAVTLHPGAGVSESDVAPSPAESGAPSSRAPGARTGEDRPALFRSLSIHSGSVSRGGIRAESSEGAVSRGGWQTGDAFFLRFDLDHDGSVMLYHVDPTGVAERLYPQDPEAPPRVFRAGTSVELPLPEGGEEWVFEGEPGIETFLLAMGDTATWNQKAAISEVDRAAALKESAEDAVARIQSALTLGGGFVRVLRVDHRAVEERAP